MELKESFLLKYLDFYQKCKQEYNIYCSLDFEAFLDDPMIKICLEGNKDIFEFNKDFKFYFDIFLRDLEGYFSVSYDYTSYYWDCQKRKFSKGNIGVLNIILDNKVL